MRAGRAARLIGQILLVAALIIPAIAIAETSSGGADAEAMTCTPIADTGFTDCDLNGTTGVDDPQNPCDGFTVGGARRNNPATVVQYAEQGESFIAICLLEQIVVREMVAERGVEFTPEEQAEVMVFGRDEIRSRLFNRLLDIQERFSGDPSTVNAIELSALAWAHSRQGNIKQREAQAAVDEYAKWKADPCNYVPPAPHEYDTSADPACTGGLSGLFTDVKPPPLQDFVSFGFTKVADELGKDVADTYSNLAARLAVTAALIAVGAVVATAATAAAITFSSAIAGLIFFAQSSPAGGPVGVAIGIITLALVAVLLQGQNVFEHAAIESQLDARLALASSGGPTILKPEDFFTAFADATSPRFEAGGAIVDSATPDPGVDTPFLATTQEGTTTISKSFYYSSGGYPFRAWISDNWWVIERVDDPSIRSLSPDLPIAGRDGTPRAAVTALVADKKFAKTEFGEPPKAVVANEFQVDVPPRSDPSDASPPGSPRRGFISFITPRQPFITSFGENVNEGGVASVTGLVDGADSIRVEFSNGRAAAVVDVDPATNGWRWDGVFPQDTGGTPITVSFAGVSVLGVGAADEISLTVNNVAPTIDSFEATDANGRSRTFFVGEAISYDVAISDPGADDHVTRIDFPGGAFLVDTGQSPSFTRAFTTPGTKEVTIRVDDYDGGVTLQTIQVEVIDGPSVTDVVFPTGNEAQVLAITGRLAETSPPDSSILVTNPDGSRSGVLPSADGSFSYPVFHPDNGAFEYTVTAIDIDSRPGNSVTGDVVANNVAPIIDSITATGPGAAADPFFVGDTIDVAVEFSDPSYLDTHTVAVDWGDGSSDGPAAATTLSHAYSSPGSFTATVTVEDDDGGTDDDTIDIVVLVRPTLSDVAFPSGNEGDTLAITGVLAAADLAASAVRVSPPTGVDIDVPVSAIDGTFSFDVSETDNGTFAYTLTPIGEVGQLGEAVSGAVVVANVSPTITSASAVSDAGAPGPFAGDDAVVAQFTFTDPSDVDTHTVVVEWGDGSMSTGAPTDTFDHVYSNPAGTGEATVTVTDDDGGSASETIDVVFDLVGPDAVITVDEGITAANRPVDFTVTFDEVPIGFDLTDISIDGVTGTLTVEPTADPAVFGVTVTPSSDGTFRIVIDPDGVTDAVGNPGVGGTSPAVTFIAGDPDPTSNDAPQIVITGSPTIERGVPVDPEIVVSDPDLLDGELTINVTTSAGSLTAAGPALASGSGTDSLVLVGTTGEVATTLDSVELTADGLGELTLIVTADDGGNTGGPAAEATASRIIDVVDTTAPALTVPEAVRATTDPGRATAVVDFDVTASDAGTSTVAALPLGFAALTTSSVAVSCQPASGSAFMIGETTVECTASDTAGNSSSRSFVVTVVDDEGPRFDSAADQTVPGSGIEAATFATPVATDNSGRVAVSCDPSSVTDLDTATTVTCEAIDPSGNTATTSFDVTVVDDEDPTFDSTTAQTATASGSGGATFVAPSATDNSGQVAVTCDPPAGTRLDMTTTVTCEATDASGNTVTASFVVTVSANVNGEPQAEPPSGLLPATGRDLGLMRIALMVLLAGVALLSVRRRPMSSPGAPRRST